MPRLAPIPREEMTDAQRAMVDAILSGPRGSLAGPFEPWLYSPELGNPAQALGEFCRFHSSLEPRLAELAIIVTGAYWQAQFEFWFHAQKAIEYGLAAAVVEAIRVGQDPAEEALYRLVTEALRNRRVSDATYRTAVEALGERCVVEAVGIVGYYSLVSLTLNVFQVGLPEGARAPFPEP